MRKGLSRIIVICILFTLSISSSTDASKPQSEDDLPPFKFPWSLYTNPWYFTSGPHGYNDLTPCKAYALDDPNSDFALSGIDFDKSDRLEVLAMADGRVIQAGWRDGGWGYTVEIDHSTNCTLCGYQTMYAHLAANPMINPGMTVGMQVLQGTVIGILGQSGLSKDAGSHLHVELQSGGKPIPWDGVLIDGWKIRSTKKEADLSTGFNYKGTATLGIEAYQSQSICSQSAAVTVGVNGTRYAISKGGKDSELDSSNGPFCMAVTDTDYSFNAASGSSTAYRPCTKLNLAVTPSGYDDIGVILSRPELNYPWTEILITDLQYKEFLGQFDTIFINCSWEMNNTTDVITAIQQYVQSGGSLYASDYAYEYIQEAFPTMIYFYGDQPKVGLIGTVMAEITDIGLANYVNPQSPPDTMALNYNLGAWVVIDNVSPAVTVHLRGDLITSNGMVNGKPLAVSFRPYPDSPGKVIFTTFHNEAQQTDIERKLLEYFVLVPTTGELALEVEQLIESSGSYVKQVNINTINQGVTSPQFSYPLNNSANLIFAANWPGSNIRLSVNRPDGTLYDQIQSIAPPISISIPDAPPGIWSYQVTGIDVPYNNYPYVVGVGDDNIYFIHLPTITSNYLSGFSSQFNGSAPGWEPQSGTWSVESNSYSTPGIPGAWSSSSYATNYTNFDYQARFRRSGCPECSYGAIVRGTPTPLGSGNRWNIGYGFYINRNGQYGVFKYTNGSGSVLQNWTDSSTVNTGDSWNILRVTTNGNTLTFYVNGTQVWSGADSSYLSGRVGIAMYRTSESISDHLWADWATLIPMSVISKASLQDTISVEQQVLNEQANRIEGIHDNIAP